MAHNIITNHSQQKTLKSRLNTLISISDELKFLVGFFISLTGKNCTKN